MKLQLSIWAENLRKRGLRQPDPYAVVTLMSKEAGAKPVALGKTETIANTVDPDWTKLFWIDNYQLGSELNFVVSIYNGENNKAMGSALFEVGRILGAKGSILGKELKDQGGIVVASLESAHDFGSLQFQLQGLDLIPTQRMRQPDPFFEVQRLRHSAVSGARLWDTIFRSPPIQDTVNPVWGSSFLELSTLCGAHRDKPFRLVVYDHKENGNHVIMGATQLNLDALVQAASGGPEVDRDKALPLKQKGQDAGYIAVLVADVTEPESLPQLDTSPEEPLKVYQNDQEEEIAVAAQSEELTLEGDDDINFIAPTFANFVSGGCELHAMVAIDATASNGDPRQSTSLHRFDSDHNDYKKSLSSICRPLSNFDSDQRYPVYGFGAKRDGQVNHCFSLHDKAGDKQDKDSYVHGVEGILEAYDQAFKSGIIMSSPRDFSQVVRQCTAASLDELENGHAYSILVLLTNGVPADMAQNVLAFQEADSAPLSCVIVGIGDGDFAGMQEFIAKANQGRDKVRFVHTLDAAVLSAAALDHIPGQLEYYFKERNIYPNPEADGADEIVVEPYNEVTDIEVPIEMNQAGDPVVTEQNGTTTPPDGKPSQNQGGQNPGKLNNSVNQIMTEGRKMMKKHKRQIGRIQRNMKREIKKKFPQARFLL